MFYINWIRGEKREKERKEREEKRAADLSLGMTPEPLTLAENSHHIDVNPRKKKARSGFSSAEEIKGKISLTERKVLPSGKTSKGCS